MVYSKDQLNKIVNDFLQRIHSGHSLKQAYLFGSYAKGTASVTSDIDIALIFNHLDQSGVFDEAFEVFHEAQEFNPFLEPICFSKEEFDDGLTPIVYEIKQTGIELLRE